MGGNNGNSKISRILVATDGSAHARSAVEYAARLAAHTLADLTAIHVIDAKQLVVAFHQSLPGSPGQ